MSKMSPLDLARKLRLPREVIEQLSAFTVAEETATRLQEAFRQDPKVFEIAAREYDNSDLLVLSLYLRWAMDTHFLYAIRGMDYPHQILIIRKTAKTMGQYPRRFAKIKQAPL